MTVRDVAAVAQRLEMVRRIAVEIEGYVVELGADGRLLSLQLDELVAGVDADRELIARDYLPPGRRASPHAADVLDDARRAHRASSCSTSRSVAKALGHPGGGPRARRQPARLPAARQGPPAARTGGRAHRRALRRSAEDAGRRASTTCRPSRASARAGPAPCAKGSRGWPSRRSSNATSDLAPLRSRRDERAGLGRQLAMVRRSTDRRVSSSPRGRSSPRTYGGIPAARAVGRSSSVRSPRDDPIDDHAEHRHTGTDQDDDVARADVDHRTGIGHRTRDAADLSPRPAAGRRQLGSPLIRAPRSRAPRPGW